MIVPIQTWAQDKEVDLIVNGEHIHDVVTIEQSGRTLISVRQLAEMLAADVNFEKRRSTVVFQKNGHQTSLRPSLIKDGRSFAPLRSVAEALGATVDFDAANNSIEIWAEGIDFPRQPNSVTTPSAVVSKAAKNATIFNVTIDGRSVTLKDGLIYRDGVRFVSAEDTRTFFATDGMVKNLYGGTKQIHLRFYGTKAPFEEGGVRINDEVDPIRWARIEPKTHELFAYDNTTRVEVSTWEKWVIVGGKGYWFSTTKPSYTLPARVRDSKGKFFMPIAILKAAKYEIEDKGDTFVFYSRDGNMGGAAQWLEPATAQ